MDFRVKGLNQKYVVKGIKLKYTVKGLKLNTESKCSS